MIHTMFVWVCSFDTVTSVSLTIVEVSTTTTTTVAIWVTVRVTVWYEMAVTVMGALDKWLISKPQSLWPGWSRLHAHPLLTYADDTHLPCPSHVWPLAQQPVPQHIPPEPQQ